LKHAAPYMHLQSRRDCILQQPDESGISCVVLIQGCEGRATLGNGPKECDNPERVVALSS
jgi:hypothetical protein